MKLKLEYGVFLFFMSVVSSLMLLALGQGLVMLIESSVVYFTLKTF